MATAKAQHITIDSDRPYSRLVAVTKSDATILPVTRGLFVGGLGDVAVTMADGTTGTFPAIPAGTFLRLQVQQVLAATTATLILALY